MDLGRSWKVIEKFLFSPPGILIGIFGFLAVVNAFVLWQRFNVIELKTVAALHSQNSRIFEKIVESFKWTGKDSFFCKKCRSKQVQNSPKTELNVSMDKLMLSFYLGFAVTHLPGALLVERYGGEHILLTCVFLTTGLAVITSSVVSYYGVKGLICIRVLMGMSEGSLLTALNSLIFRQLESWHDVSYRTLPVTAAHVAILIVNLASMTLMHYLESHFIYYSLGIWIIFWFISFQVFCYSNLEFFPNIQEVEEPNSQRNSGLSLNFFNQLHDRSWQWHLFLASSTLWALIGNILQHDWTQSLIMTELHILIQDVKEMNIWESCCSFSKIVMPFILSWLISTISEILADILVDRDILNGEEAINYRVMMESFVPKTCSDFVSCLLSHDRNNVLTTFYCTMSVLNSCYMGIKFGALNTNNQHGDALMNLVKDFGSLMTIMMLYIGSLSKIGTNWD